MNKSLFYKKIICLHCGGNFKRRKNRNKYVWVCSRVDNYGDCVRVQVNEEFLISTIQNRYELRGVDIPTKEDIRNKVDCIQVRDRYLLTIKLKDFEDEIVFGENVIIF